MMSAPERPSMGSMFPKRNPPHKQYVPFDAPKPRCGVPHCPSFCTPRCGLCDMHCARIHKGRHTIASDAELQDMIKKYQEGKN